MLFISPAESRFGGAFSHYMPLSQPVAIGTLAAWLIKHDINSAVLDDQVTTVTPSVIREKLQGLEEPYIFGITCMTAHVARAYPIAKMIRAEFPNSTIVAGGLHPTALPEEPLGTGLFDYVLRGESELPILKLYEAIRNGYGFEKVPSLTYMKDGKLVNNPEGPMLLNLDDLPMFPHHLMMDKRYERGFLISSRGCPYKCTYCSQRMMTGTTYRYKSAERIVAEIEELVNRFGEKLIMFYDDNFCVKNGRVVDICNLILEKGLQKKTQFTIQTRADNFPESLVPLMSESGFKQVIFGVETGTNRLADIISKDESIETHNEAIALAQKHGISVSLAMIYGLPTERSEDREIGFKYVMSHNAHSPKFNNLVPYPGTPLYSDLKKSNRLIITKDWGNFDSTLSGTNTIFQRTPLAYVPETCSEWELKRDIVRNNIRANLTIRNIINLTYGRGEFSWLKLPDKWYFKPTEVFHLFMALFILFTNMIVTYLPLWLTEPIMHLIQPSMKKRVRIKDPKISMSYKPSGWSPTSGKLKAELLAFARKEQKGREVARVN